MSRSGTPLDERAAAIGQNNSPVQVPVSQGPGARYSKTTTSAMELPIPVRASGQSLLSFAGNDSAVERMICKIRR